MRIHPAVILSVPKFMPNIIPKSDADSRHDPHTSWQHIWRLSWPIMLSNITVPMIGVVDVAMMGQLDDPAFIGGVGLGMLVFNFMYFGLGFLRMGTTGMVAQMHGAEQNTAIAHLLMRGVSVAVGVGGLFILFSPLVTSAAMTIFSASNMVEALMAEYITIRLFAAPAALANLVLLGGIYGKQQMQLGMALLFIVNGLNLLLDIILVNGFGMTVDGIAFASVAAQWSGFSFMLWWIARAWPGQLGQLLRPLSKAKLPIWFDLSAFRQFFSLGRDIFIRTILLLSCEALFLNEAAKLGDLQLAACQIMLSIFGLLAFAIDGFAHAAEALVGEAIGQKNKSALNIVIWRTNYLAGVVAVLQGALLWLGKPFILGLMTGQADLIAFIDAYWIWVAILPLASFLAFQMDGVFVGATRGKEMRNAMLVASASFAATILLIPIDLMVLMGGFVGYLALRGISLCCLISHVYKMANPLDRPK
jgi:MATE family multidrug resistance protein